MEAVRNRTESIVKTAGRIFTDTVIDRSMIVEKGFVNFVTQVDYQVEEFLVKELGKIIPGSNIITEESQFNSFDFSKPTWILDPVDGTTNLMHSYNHSAISLLLLTEGKPLLGIVYNPAAGEMFTGISGKGAYLNDKRIKVSSNGRLEDSLIGFGTTPYDKSRAGRVFSTVEKVYMKSQEIRRSGSAALDIAYVACARLDGFFELQLQPWDYAAGLLILEEAGGKFTGWQGEKTGFSAPSDVLATNGLIHGELMELLL